MHLKKITLSIFLFSWAPGIYGILEHIKEWEDYWRLLCAGQKDLSRQEQWRDFLRIAGRRFAESSLFDPEMSLPRFIHSIFTYSLRGEKNMPGLYSAKLLLQYAPLEISPKHLPKIKESPFAKSVSPASPQIVSIEPTLPEINWGPVDYEAALDTILMCRNLGLPCANHDLSQFPSHLASLYADAMDSGNMLLKFPTCRERQLGRDTLTLTTVADYLGDGAIDGEVDINGKMLEGNHTSNTACLLTKLLERLSSKSELMERAGLNRDTLQKDIHLFYEAAATETLYEECARYENSHEVFETVLLEQLRGLQVGSQILLSIGFTEHAMAMSVRRTDPIHYDLLIFNSGSGLEYHISKIAGSKTKVLPVKMFTKLTLMDIKWSQVLQRIFQVSAMGSGIITNPEDGKPAHTSAEDLYVTALAGLVDFESNLLEEQGILFRFFTAQRSGTCSVEVLMAFLAIDLHRPYNILKLLLYKDLIELAFGIEWDEREKHVIYRILKYGIENHARAALRLFHRNQDKPANLLLRDLLPADLWSKYGQVKDGYVLPKPKAFRVDLEGLKPSADFQKGHIEAALKINEAFIVAKQSNQEVEFHPGNYCKEADSGINGAFESVTIVHHVGCMVYYMNNCRIRQNPGETLMFLAVTVINKWPDPDAQYWKDILGKNCPDHETNLNAIWRFVQDILKVQHESGKGNVYFFTCVHKIMMIFQHVLGESYQQLMDCSSETKFYLRLEAYQCLSGDIVAYHRKFAGRGGVPCFDASEPITYLESILKELVRTYLSSYQDFNTDIRYLAVLHYQKNDSIPSVLYYWHVCRKIVAHLEKVDFNGWNQSFPYLMSDTYHPFMDHLNHVTKIGICDYVDPTMDPPKLPRYMAMISRERDAWCKDFAHHSDAEEKLYVNVLMTDHDQLGKFSHLLHVVPDTFTWAAILHIGTAVAHRPHSLDTLTEAITHINLLIDELKNDLSRSANFLAQSPLNNPGLKQKCELYSGLIVVESILVNAKPELYLQNSRKHLSEVMRFLNDVVQLHDSYKALIIFSYLASLPSAMAEEEVDNAILLHRRLQSGLRLKLPHISALDQYLDHIQANVIRAFFSLTANNFSERSKKYVDPARGKLIEFGFISTSQKASTDYYFDLISGAEIINGSLTSNLSVEDLHQFYVIANVNEDLKKLKFTSIQHQFLGQSQLIICVIDKGSRSITKGRQLFELVQIELLITKADTENAVYIGEKYSVSTGGTHEADVYAIRLPYHKDSIRQIPIPAILDDTTPYHILAFPASGEMAFILDDEQIWINDNGQITFQDHKLQDLQYLPFTENEVINPLASYKDIVAFKATDTSYRLLFRNYADSIGNPLWFIWSDGKWKLLSDLKLHIAENQDFTTSGMLTKYLVLKGEGKVLKTLIPVEHYQLEETSGDWNDHYVHLRKNCFNISLTKVARTYYETVYLKKLSNANQRVDKKQKILSLIPHPKSRQESLLLLYNYLVTRHYHQAMKEANKIHQMEPFDGEEHRLLGWIAQSHLATKNGSPESIAIRSFTCFHVFNNEMLFHSFGRKIKNSNEAHGSNPYIPAIKWKTFWAEEHFHVASQCVPLYINRLTKVPLFLRFDPDARFNRVSPTQWTIWLNAILDNPAEHAKNLNDLEFYIRPRSLALQSASNHEDVQPEDVFYLEVLSTDTGTGQDSNPNVSKYSFVNPAIFLKDRNLLLAKIILGDLNSETSEKLYQWIQPYENMHKFSDVARVLQNALLLSRSDINGYIGQPCSPFFQLRRLYSHECDQDLKILIEDLKSHESPSINDGNGKEIYEKRNGRKFQEKAYDTDLTTSPIGDNIFGLSFSMKVIKNRLCEGKKVDSLLKSFVKKLSNSQYFLDRNLDLFDHFREIVDLKGKLKFIEQMMKLYEQRIFTDFVTRGYPKYDFNSEDDKTVVKGLETIAHGKLTIIAIDIIHMYAKAQSEYYRQYFPYFDGDVNQLHELATQFVLAHSNRQEMKRLREAYSTNDHKKFEVETCERFRSTDTTMNNMLAYECSINSRLTGKQIRDIIKMTKKTKEGRYPDIFVQWIMSAGKTYILGTLLSVMKADHKHLSILVVPKALLTGEASNLFTRTIAAFSRDGFSFKLARDPDLADLATLKWITESISSARKRGQYIIMSADMLEGLHDKFVELGQGKNSNSSAEYDEMCELLRIILHHGAMTVDEAHKIFDPTQETNFPIVKSKHDTDDNANSLSLEAHVLTEVFRMLSGQNELTKSLNGKEFTKNIPIDLNTDPHQITKAIGLHLVDHLFNQDHRWLAKIEKSDLAALKSISQEDLIAFLIKDSRSIKSREIKPIKRKTSPDLYRALAVCRMAITSWIPLAWSGNVNENYGLEPGKKYSIPYSGAFAPKIGSEFAFRWYCYARTIRTYLVNGFDETTIKWSMSWLQKCAFKEISMKEEVKVASDILNALFGLKSPFKLDLDSKEQIDSILRSCKEYHRSLNESGNLPESLFHAYTEFLFRWIAEDVIPSVDYYTQQISTNSQDISYMVDSRQLYSGSVVSVRTFPRQFLDFDPEKVKLDDTINSRIRQAVIDNTLEVSVVPDGFSSDKFASYIAEASLKIPKDNPIVAVLDVGAYFKDQKNEQVAASLLNVRESVLYFSTSKNKLALITRDDPNEKLLHTYSAETIKEIVPDESKRITFYDQQHNTGVDIFQLVDGCALIIIGAKTTSIDFYQSAMRMRKFLDSQKLFIVVPEHVIKAMKKEKLPSPIEILEFMEGNLQASVLNLNSMALSQMIAAVFKEAAYNKLLNGQFNKELFNLWVKDTSSDVNDLVVPQRYQDYRNGIVPRIIASYVDKVRPYFTMEELLKLEQLANETIKNAFGKQPDNLYPKECLCAAPFAEGSATDDESQSLKVVENMESDMLAVTSVEAESNLKMETENEQETFATPPTISVLGRINWKQIYMPLMISESHPRLSFRNFLFRSGLFKVNDILNADSKNPSIFSDSLMMTSGFAQRGAMFGQNRSFIPHCFATMTNDGTRFLVLVDQYEAEAINGILNFKDSRLIFGNPAALIDPVRRIVNNGGHPYKKKDEWLQDFDPLLWEAVFFAGYMRILARPDAKASILNFLGPSENSISLKSAILTDIIISKAENVLNARSFPGNKSFIQYVGTPKGPYEECQKSHYLELHNFLSHNRGRLSSYIARLQDEGNIHGLHDIFDLNEHILQIFSQDELVEALKVALRKFFADPSLMERPRDENIRAFDYFKWMMHRNDVLSVVARGAVTVLERIKEFPNCKDFENFFRAAAREIQKYPKEQWVKEYMQALYNFPEPHLYPSLFVAMIPETAPEGFEDALEYHVRRDRRIVAAIDPRPGMTVALRKLLKIYSANLPLELEETIYKSIQFNEYYDYDKKTITYEGTLALIDNVAKKVIGESISDKPWFDQDRFACISFKANPRNLMPIGRLLKDDDEIARAVDAFAYSRNLQHMEDERLEHAIVKNLTARGCLKENGAIFMNGAWHSSRCKQ